MAMEIGSLSQVNTGIAHKDPGVDYCRCGNPARAREALQRWLLAITKNVRSHNRVFQIKLLQGKEQNHEIH
jgi:hypothetical protein